MVDALPSIRWFDVLLEACGGVLLGIGFVVTSLWWASLIGFAPILFAITREQYRLREVFLLGTLAGFVGYGLSFYEVFWSTLPLSWLGITETWFAVFAVFLIWFLTTLGFAIAAGAFAFFVRRSGASGWSMLLVVPAEWVLADWLGMWIFSIQTIGPNSLMGANFSMGSFGYLLADNIGLLQGAWLGGIFALNFEVAFFGTLIYLLFRRGSLRAKAPYVALALLVIGLWAGAQWQVSGRTAEQEIGKSLSVAAVSTQTPDVLNPSDAVRTGWFNTELASIQKIRGADLVVLPEGSGFLEYLYRDPVLSAREVFAKAGSSTPPMVVDSVSLKEPDGKNYSRIEYYDAATGESVYAYKRYLMPFGEQLPYLYRFIALLMGKADVVERILETRDFSLKGNALPVSVQGIPVSALLCSEAMAPTMYSGEVNDGAQVLVNLSSHAWFHGSYPIFVELRRVDAVRAAESRRWMVQAGNIAPSFIIDPYGRMQAESAWGSTETVQGVVYARTDVTPYDWLGDWVVVLFVLLAGVPGAIRRIAH